MSVISQHSLHGRRCSKTFVIYAKQLVKLTTEMGKIDIITVTSLWARWHLKSPASRFLLNSLFRRRSKKTSKLRVTGLCEGNSLWLVNYTHKRPVTWKLFPFDDAIIISADIINPWAQFSEPLLYQYATCLFLIHFSIWFSQNCHHDFSTVGMWVTWRSWLHCFINSCNYLWILPIPTSTLVSCCVPLLTCNLHVN